MLIIVEPKYEKHTEGVSFVSGPEKKGGVMA